MRAPAIIAHALNNEYDCWQERKEVSLILNIQFPNIMYRNNHKIDTLYTTTQVYLTIPCLILNC